jgi:hypothetical protein
MYSRKDEEGKAHFITILSRGDPYSSPDEAWYAAQALENKHERFARQEEDGENFRTQTGICPPDHLLDGSDDLILGYTVFNPSR